MSVEAIYISPMLRDLMSWIGICGAAVGPNQSALVLLLSVGVWLRERLAIDVKGEMET